MGQKAKPSSGRCPARGVCALAAIVVSAAAPSRAGVDRERERRLEELVNASRPGVLLLKLGAGRNGTGLASGVLIDEAERIVATSRSRLLGAGEVEAFAFRFERHDDGRMSVERESLGLAEVVALHRSADAAILSIEKAPGLSPLPRAELPPPGAPVAVCGTPGAVKFGAATDLDARDGEMLAAEGSREGGSLMSAPVHLNSAGGAVLDLDGRLVAVAGLVVPGGGPPGDGFPKDAFGAAVPLARFDELRADPDCRLSEADAASHLAPREGPPPYMRVSPGGPEGKRGALGEGIFLVKEARAVVASGVFILDEHQILEYFACPLKRGKLHETVIALHDKPSTLNFALMALGHRMGGVVETPGGRGVPRGGRLLMYVEWDHNEARAIGEYMEKVEPEWKRPRPREVAELVREGKIRWKPGTKLRARAEELVFDRYAGRPMEHTEWVYTGSKVEKDPETGKRYYKADAEGVFSAVYRDSSAVFNIPLVGAEDDTYFCVDGTKVPPRGTSCTLIIVPPERPGQDTAEPSED